MTGTGTSLALFRKASPREVSKVSCCSQPRAVCPAPVASGASGCQREAASDCCPALFSFFPRKQGPSRSLQATVRLCLHICFSSNRAAALPIGSSIQKGLTRATAPFPLLYRAYLVCTDCCNDCRISSDERRIFLNSLCNFFQRDTLH